MIKFYLKLKTTILSGDLKFGATGMPYYKAVQSMLI